MAFNSRRDVEEHPIIHRIRRRFSFSLGIADTMKSVIPLLSNRDKDEKHYNGSHRKIQRQRDMYGIIQYTGIW
ncbi:hypothetical protein HMPREF1992_01933 [Selenomonas sp. oral taxon 892 str. F0426]|nr:hypothetical protein HMPREF1992_01933 [Selenomonas sp. oral taxon 892 str. F0426]